MRVLRQSLLTNNQVDLSVSVSVKTTTPSDNNKVGTKYGDKKTSPSSYCISTSTSVNSFDKYSIKTTEMTKSTFASKITDNELSRWGQQASQEIVVFRGSIHDEIEDEDFRRPSFPRRRRWRELIREGKSPEVAHPAGFLNCSRRRQTTTPSYVAKSKAGTSSRKPTKGFRAPSILPDNWFSLGFHRRILRVTLKKLSKEFIDKHTSGAGESPKVEDSSKVQVEQPWASEIIPKHTTVTEFSIPEFLKEFNMGQSSPNPGNFTSVPKTPVAKVTQENALQKSLQKEEDIFDLALNLSLVDEDEETLDTPLKVKKMKTEGIGTEPTPDSPSQYDEGTGSPEGSISESDLVISALLNSNTLEDISHSLDFLNFVNGMNANRTPADVSEWDIYDPLFLLDSIRDQLPGGE